MSRRGLLSDEEMAALLADDDDDGVAEDFETELLFTPGDFADVVELVAPLLLDPFSSLAPLVDTTLALTDPGLALIGPEAVPNRREPRVLFVELDLLGGSSADTLLEVPGGLARRLAVRMIGADEEGVEEVDDVHLASLSEFFRQYRLVLGRGAPSVLAEASPALRRPPTRPAISGRKAAGKLLAKAFAGQEHLVALSASCRVGGQDAGLLRFIFTVEGSRELLRRARSAADAPLAGAPVLSAPDDDATVVDADGEEARAEEVASEAVGAAAPVLAPRSGRVSAEVAGDTVELVARLGAARLSAAELAALRRGRVVRLDVPAGDEVVLVGRDGRPVARGEVVVDGDHYAIVLSRVEPGSGGSAT